MDPSTVVILVLLVAVVALLTKTVRVVPQA